MSRAARRRRPLGFLPQAPHRADASEQRATDSGERTESASGAGLSCLWLARCDPFPMDSGDNLYTGMLVDAFAATGAAVTFVGLRRSRAGDGWGGSVPAVRFHPVPGSANPLWRAVLSRRPQVAAKHRTRAYRREFERLLSERRWDVIVVDQYGMGWALDAIERAFAGGAARPVVVHVAHDHEAGLTRDIARNSTAGPLTRLMLRLNAWKTAVAEGELVARCDLLTAITAADRDRFLAAAPGKPHVVLTPGYAGPRVAGREITADVPRRAVILGSFTWTAKIMNLREFLAVADPLFAAAGAELWVVGTVDPRVAGSLRARLRATRFTGYVADPTPELLGARIGVVPERTGGGFKLKLLDYLFHGLPIAAVADATAGWPDDMADALLRYDDLPSLARGVVEALDDLALLNGLQRRALAGGGTAFAWPDRGAALRRAVEERRRARTAAAPPP